ncbi:DoxX family protein [Roseateles puraquae]|uniref:DoxX family protein n=1 Tax=Roseateles puraquae TaxID=431059 RepID=A0A254NDF3_9BURK|nr:DoxX family protein [Roseateles puraquae]MDG0854604.1 DoxX family protein [Roseateles puraquae]OWR05995.1 DoxX family protein [Roseateles puraquae]
MALRRLLHGLALLALCAAYLEGGITKLMDFGGALAEMQHFGLAPAAPLAVAVIALELGGSALVLSGHLRWLGALALGAFTVAASFIANDFWAMSGPDRISAMHAFFEHLGLAGGFALVAWHDRLEPAPAI